MTGEANAEIILRWFDALNYGDIAKLDHLAEELFTDDFVWHDPRLIESGNGSEIVKKFIHQVLRENTNVHVTVEEIFSDRDKTASRFNVSMTNSASGKPLTIQLLAIDRFVHGRIAEEWQLSSPGQW